MDNEAEDFAAKARHAATSRHMFQAQPGQLPPNRPELWEPIPMTAKGQLVKYADPNDPVQAPFFEIGLNGTEDEARDVLGPAMAVCHRIDPMPSAGITEHAVHFTLPDGTSFRPTPAPGTKYYETMSQLFSITLPSTLQSGQSVTVNGRALRPGTNYPLSPHASRGLPHQGDRRRELHGPVAAVAKSSPRVRPASDHSGRVCPIRARHGEAAFWSKAHLATRRHAGGRRGPPACRTRA